MNNTKPLVGILATPYIKNNTSNEVFLKENVLTFLKQNSIDYIIIPYNIKKSDLNKILYKLDGLLFPGSQIGNLYNNKYIKQHFLTQKYIVKKIKKLDTNNATNNANNNATNNANNNIIIPILAICHGYENMILIEKNYNLTKKNINSAFINVSSFNDYKSIPKFKNNKLAKLLKSNFNKTKKLIHNNALAIDPKHRIQNYEIIATSLDKNNKEFIDIVKHKKYPFFGYQGHPEINNAKLFSPFISYVKTVFNKRKLNHKLVTKKKYYNLNLIKLKSRKVSCKKYNLAKTIKHGKYVFYKI
jgi:gamma-glutamyl-gamma-aminobutyrate hydrolase PuuD